MSLSLDCECGKGQAVPIEDVSEGTVCSVCGWVLNNMVELQLFEEGEPFSSMPASSTFVSARDNGTNHLRYAGRVHNQAGSYEHRSSKRELMEQVFTTASSQLGLAYHLKQRMQHIADQVMSFLTNRRRAYVQERTSRESTLLANETMEETKQRRAIEKRARDRDTRHSSVYSQMAPLAGAIIYIVCREENKPITLGTIAMTVGTSAYSIGKAFSQIKRHLNLGFQDVEPVMFIEPAVAKLSLPDGERKALRKLAVDILEHVGEEAWVGEGRLKVGVALASIILAAEFSKVKIAARELLPPDVKMCTIKTRVSELKQTLVDCAPKYSPFEPGLVTRKSLNHYALQIISGMKIYHNAKKEQIARNVLSEPSTLTGGTCTTTATPPTLTMATTSSATAPSLHPSTAGRVLSNEQAIRVQTKLQVGVLPPPSFTSAEVARERRRAKLVMAKKRIAQMLQNAPMAKRTLEQWGVRVAPEWLGDVTVKAESNGSGEGSEQSAQCETSTGKRKRKRQTKVEEGERRSTKRRQTEGESELDDEDAKIERCLLAGVSESEILAGNYELAEGRLASFPPVSHSEELTETDLTEEEASHYILTSTESLLFRALRSRTWPIPEDNETQSPAAAEQHDQPPTEQ